MNVEGFSRGLEGGLLSLGFAMDAGIQRARARDRQRAEINVIGQWQAYCNKLRNALLASRKREAQLKKDLADAMRVIEALERRH
jgi:hypothetical protein